MVEQRSLCTDHIHGDGIHNVALHIIASQAQELHIQDAGDETWCQGWSDRWQQGCCGDREGPTLMQYDVIALKVQFCVTASVHAQLKLCMQHSNSLTKLVLHNSCLVFSSRIDIVVIALDMRSFTILSIFKVKVEILRHSVPFLCLHFQYTQVK